MRRSKPVRMAWGKRLARGLTNERLARALAAAEAMRDTRKIAGALAWDRAGRLTLIEVFHETGRRSVQVRAEARPGSGPAEDIAGLRWPGVAAVVLMAMGFGRTQRQAGRNEPGRKS